MTETDPHKFPDAPCSGTGNGGTYETGSWSWWDLYENKIGEKGEGINGWTAYYYPEFGGDLLHNPDEQMIISYSSPNSVVGIVDICNKIKCKGVFSWEIDDDNGLLLEAMLASIAEPASECSFCSKDHVYAPECESLGTAITIKEGMIVT